MQHQLARLRFGRAESDPIHDVIQAPLQHDDEILAGRTFGFFGLVKISAELPFQQPVRALHLLLFAQLQTITLNFGPP